MKTNNPYRYTILLIALVIVIACGNSRKFPSLKTQYKEIYVNQFKLTYFKSLLMKSYNNSNAIREIIETDHSGFTEPVLSESDFNLIDSLTTLDNYFLVADSIAGRHRGEGSQGKRPLGFVMEKLSSKWLDSIAKRRLKLSHYPDF